MFCGSLKCSSYTSGVRNASAVIATDVTSARSKERMYTVPLFASACNGLAFQIFNAHHICVAACRIFRSLRFGMFILFLEL